MINKKGRNKGKSVIEKTIDNLTLFNNTLMQKVFDKNIAATEYLIKTILKRKDIKVIEVKGQYDMQSPLIGGRNVTLDILVETKKGKRINIEVQQNSGGSHYRRARFHSSMLDSRMLKEGQEFKELKDSYVIFIYKHDKFRKGLPVYHVKRYVCETEMEFRDGSNIIYVNGAYKGDDEIGKMLHDFRCKKSKDVYNRDLAEGIRHFKESKEGREEMKDPVEEYAKKCAKEAETRGERRGERRGEKKTRILDIKNIMKNMGCTLEQALDALEINGKDRAAIIGKMKP